MQQNGAAPLLLWAGHGTKENYLPALLQARQQLTFFQLLQVSDAPVALPGKGFSRFPAAWPLP